MFEVFQKGEILGKYAEAKKGLSTGDNNIFIRNWFEINFRQLGLNLASFNPNFKWYPINKGGSFRKWYGNNLAVVNWENDGEALKNFKKSVIRNSKFYFKEGLTWTMISSGNFGIRFSRKGSLFEGAGPSLFAENHLLYFLGFLTTSLVQFLLNMINPTLNYNIENIKNLPILFNDYYNSEIGIYLHKK